VATGGWSGREAARQAEQSGAPQNRDLIVGGKGGAGRQYSATVYTVTVYSATVYSATVYSATVYSATVYSATVYSVTVYSATVYSATVYSATVYSATIYLATVYYILVSMYYCQRCWSLMAMLLSRREFDISPALPAVYNCQSLGSAVQCSAVQAYETVS
jgi:hypothetical protein